MTSSGSGTWVTFVAPYRTGLRQRLKVWALHIFQRRERKAGFVVWALVTLKDIIILCFVRTELMPIVVPITKYSSIRSESAGHHLDSPHCIRLDAISGESNT